MGGLLPRRRYQHYGLDRDAVEQLSFGQYQHGHPYWLTMGEAGEVLGLSDERARQLILADRLPFVLRDGRKFMRRPQVEIIANARQSRHLQL